jgi:DNA polymerase III epsilon subunit-like protein/predicted GIY-YIG superfamily endonuclease
VRSLAELDVLVVDCQATGASPAFGHVLEIGWGIQRAGDATLSGATAHWISLPEGHRVPLQVRKITGYDPSLAIEAITDSEAWRRLRTAIGEIETMPTAIHYARFELSFLRDWGQRLEPDRPFPFDAICLHAIARRLYPDLPRQSIRALAGYLGYSLDLTRRSLGHVEATGFVWRKMRDELAARGVGSWEELREFLAERPKARPASTVGKKRRYPILAERYRALPDQPGVYRFLRSNGDVLYVGKAASLRKRVKSHFDGRAANAQAPEMLTQVNDVAVTVVASVLEAAVLENETIKALRPPYNVQLVAKDAPVWHESLAFDGRVAGSPELHRIGPLPSNLSLRPLAALIALLSGSPVTELLRSQAVGVSALLTPDESVFAAAWAQLIERHRQELRAPVSPRRCAFELARKLLTAGSEQVPENAGEAEKTHEADAWDPPRVVRHLERSVVQAYRAYRRAHWLGLIHDSDIVYREPSALRGRLLKVRGGAVVAMGEVPPGYVPEERFRPIAMRKAAVFDRAKYERLRVLTTELRRILRDGGEVAVFWGPRRRLPARWLPGVLAAT